MFDNYEVVLEVESAFLMPRTPFPCLAAAKYSDNFCGMWITFPLHITDISVRIALP
jgi:hypothetical protein